MIRDILPKVCVAVLNYNGLQWLQGCLDSLAKTAYPNFEVLIADNGSTDGSQEFIKSRYPSMKLMAFDENLGFTGGYNRMFAYSDADYFVLLNNDTVVPEPNWINLLVAKMEEDPSIAAATCKLVYLSDPERINSIGGRGYWWTGSFDVGDGELDHGQYDDEKTDPFSFSGAAAMVRLPLIHQLNGFDEELFAYREDFDLSWRLRLQGYKIVLVPGAKILHAGGGSFGSLSYGKLHLSSRNWLRLMLKNYEASTLARGLLIYLVFEFVVRLFGTMWVKKNLRFGLIPFHSILWNIKHLKSTLRERQKVQKNRTIRDAAILESMGPGGFEPIHHLLKRVEILKKNTPT